MSTALTALTHQGWLTTPVDDLLEEEVITAVLVIDALGAAFSGRRKELRDRAIKEVLDHGVKKSAKAKSTQVVIPGVGTAVYTPVKDKVIISEGKLKVLLDEVSIPRNRVYDTVFSIKAGEVTEEQGEALMAAAAEILGGNPNYATSKKDTLASARFEVLHMSGAISGEEAASVLESTAVTPRVSFKADPKLAAALADILEVG